MNSIIIFIISLIIEIVKDIFVEWLTSKFFNKKDEKAANENVTIIIVESEDDHEN